MEYEYKYKMNFAEWIEENKGYKYYVPQLVAVINHFDFECIAHRARLFYKGLLLTVMEIRNQSIVLTKDYDMDVYNYSVVQRKLFHDYERTFNLENIGKKKKYVVEKTGLDPIDAILSRWAEQMNKLASKKSKYIFTDEGQNGEYRLTQTNLFLFKRYLENAVKKINAGFVRYEELLSEQGLTNSENVGFIKIDVNGAFSFSELRKLIYEYNMLYSLIQSVCNFGIEEVEKYPEIYENKYSIILESISIASPGVVVGVLSAVAANLITHFILESLANNKAEADKYKEAAIAKAREDSAAIGDRVEVLLQRWERNLRRKKEGLLPQGVIDIEIERIMEEIKKLQGIPTINVLI